MKKLAKIVRFVLGRNWVMPVVALVGSIICFAGLACLCDVSMGADVEKRHWLGQLSIPLQITQLLLFFGLPLWLVVLTIVRLIKHQYHVWWAWLWAPIAGVGMFVCLAAGALASSFACYDDFAREHRLPDEMTPANMPGMAVPLGFSFYTIKDESQMSSAVNEWKKLLHVDSSMCISGDEQLTDAAPNVEKLVAEAPELLLEYKLRAACHVVLTPGVKVAPHLDTLRRVDEHHLGAECHFWREDDIIWQKPLQNGWEIYTRCSDWGDNKVPSAFELKKLQMLNEGLAALAANPTREGLDALLPPLPDKPTLVLREDFQPGIYKAMLVVPRDYPEGTFRVKACEYTRKTPLSMELVELTPEPYREFCKLAVSDDFTVYSGEWGELYASTWELHFTPADGGESRCVNSQVYLMQGWSR